MIESINLFQKIFTKSTLSTFPCFISCFMKEVQERIMRLAVDQVSFDNIN